MKHKEIMVASNTAEVVVDMSHVHDLQMHYSDFLKCYFELQRVKMEIRPHIPSRDEKIPYVHRIIVASGTKLVDILDELKNEWRQPVKHYHQHHVFPLST